MDDAHSPDSFSADQHLAGIIDLKALDPEASFLRILGVNYIHIRTRDEGDLYLTEHGVPFINHLDPHNWFETDWFSKHRQRLAGTSTVYRIATRPIENHLTPSIDVIIKWSRVGEDVALDTMALDRNVNAEFNTPFEEFARVEELRRSEPGPGGIRVLTQKPLGIFVPPERMQLWQTGRSLERVLARTARHPGIEIDVLRAYIMLYGWVDGLNAVEAFSGTIYDSQERARQLQELTLRVDRDLASKNFVVADHKPSHIIVRMNSNHQLRRRKGNVAYALVDYELLSRTAAYEDWVRAAKRKEYLVRQRDRFTPRPAATYPRPLKPARVLGVDYVCGRAESTSGTLWVVGNDPDLFPYFLPERWRGHQQVRLASEPGTYYVQTKDRIHLVWKVSRVGEVPQSDVDPQRRERQVELGFNSPFEEFDLAFKMLRAGLKVTYPRAIYMTAGAVPCNGQDHDARRFEQAREVLAPTGASILPDRHDFVTIWGFWRGLEDSQAADDTMLWTPIDVATAAAKGIIDQPTAAAVISRHALQMAREGFEDLNLRPKHVLICYVPSGSIKRGPDGQIETRQCNFELVAERNRTTRKK